MSGRRGEKERLIEAVVSAERRRDAEGRILPSAAFWDLAPDERAAAFEEQLLARALEAAWDRRGLSTTARVVVERSRRLGQLKPDDGGRGGA